MKVFIRKCGFCKQTLLGVTGLLWQSLLGHTGLPEQTILGRTGLLGKALLGQTGLKTVLKQIFLKKIGLLEQILLG